MQENHSPEQPPTFLPEDPTLLTPPPAEQPKKKFPFLIVTLFFLAVSTLALMYVATNLLQYNNAQQVTANNSPLKIKDKLIVGTDATFEPMESLDPDGDFVGYDIELGQRLASQMGTEIEFKNINWDSIFTALENGELDMIISSVTITDERKQKYSFSDEYLNAGQVIVTKKTDTTISSTADLSGKRIAVQKGTTNETQAMEFTSPDLVLAYDDFLGATQALINGDADAIFSDLTGAKGIINQNPELKIASEPFTSDYYGIVIRKEDSQLLEAVNQSLNALRQQGVLIYLKQKWLE